MLPRIALGSMVSVVWFSGLANLIDITPSAGGGPTPQELAGRIADQAGGVPVEMNSATTMIKNA